MCAIDQASETVTACVFACELSCTSVLCVFKQKHERRGKKEGSVADSLTINLIATRGHEANFHSHLPLPVCIHTHTHTQREGEWVRLRRVCDSGSVVGLSLMWVGQNIKVGR